MRLIIVARTLVARLAGRPAILFAAGMILGIGCEPSGIGLWMLLATGVLAFRRTRFALVVLGLAFGGWRAHVHAHLPADHVSRLGAQTRMIEGEVWDLRGDRAWVECRHADGVIVSGRVQVENVGRGLEPGESARFYIYAWTSTRDSAFLSRHDVFVRARCRRVEILPDSTSWRTRWWRVRRWLCLRLSDAMSEEAAAFVGGLLFGLQQGISDDLQRALRDTGTSHLLVVSGMHFVLIYALAGLLARVIYFHRRWWVAALLWTVFYGALVLMSVPVLRALVMVGLHALAHAIRRSPDPASVLGTAACVVLTLDPQDLFDPSFQLSFSAVLALILFPKNWIPSEGSSFLHKLTQGAAATMTCLLFTAPIVATHFHQFSPMTVLANLILGPLFTAMLFLGLFNLLPLIGLVSGPFSTLLFWLIKTAAISFPESSISIAAPSTWKLVVYALLLGAWTLSSRNAIRWAGAVLLPLFLVFPDPFPEPLVVQLPDRSYLFRTPEGETVLLSPGPRAQNHLDRIGCRTVDWALLTDEAWPAPRQVRHAIHPDRNTRLRVGSFDIERKEEAWIVRWREFEWRYGRIDRIDSDARWFGGDIRVDQLPPGTRLIQCAPWRTNW